MGNTSRTRRRANRWRSPILRSPGSASTLSTASSGSAHNTLFDTLAALTALPGGGPSAVVRIPATASDGDAVGWQIKQALDSGARGVLVPMCPNAEAARRVARAARFPPVGVRGLGSPVAHTLWGPDATMREYLDRANESVVVMAQIETVEGMQNVEEIAAVEGIGARSRSSLFHSAS